MSYNRQRQNGRSQLSAPGVGLAIQISFGIVERNRRVPRAGSAHRPALGRTERLPVHRVLPAKPGDRLCLRRNWTIGGPAGSSF